MVVSLYQWLPAVFRSSRDVKDAKIVSYINGLGPHSDHPDRYRSLEQLVVLFLPALERKLCIYSWSVVTVVFVIQGSLFWDTPFRRIINLL
jgi:hypothetical protein